MDHSIKQHLEAVRPFVRLVSYTAHPIHGQRLRFSMPTRSFRMGARTAGIERVEDRTLFAVHSTKIELKGKKGRKAELGWPRSSLWAERFTPNCRCPQYCRKTTLQTAPFRSPSKRINGDDPIPLPRTPAVTSQPFLAFGPANLPKFLCTVFPFPENKYARLEPHPCFPDKTRQRDRQASKVNEQQRG